MPSVERPSHCVSGVCLYLFKFARPSAAHALRIRMSVRNRLGKPVLRLDVAHLNVCQPATSTQMISRTKPSTPSSLTASLSDCSVIATASPRADLAARHDHVDSDESARSSKTAARHAPAASPAIAKTAEGGTPDVDPIFLAQEVCQMLKIGKTTLYKLNKSKQLQSFRVTARIRAWRLSAIQAYLASKEVE